MEREARASPAQGEVAKIYDFGRRGRKYLAIPSQKSKIFDSPLEVNCPKGKRDRPGPLRKGALGRYRARAPNYNLHIHHPTTR